MGQATVDLPDPLDQQPPAHPGGVDDLLSQLAGDEIDRLLAEADTEAADAPRTSIDAPVDPIDFSASETPAPEAAAAPAAPKLSPTSPLAKLNALADLPPEPGDAPADPPASAATPAVPEAEPTDADTIDAETQASLDALAAGEFEQDAESQPAAEALADPSSAAAPAGLLPPGAVEKVLADEAAGLLGATPALPSDDAGTTAAERGALDAGVDAEIAEAEAATEAPAGAKGLSAEMDAVLGDESGDAPLPVFLKPLEWINAPLAACSASFRDVVGKFAIVTTINALAVLIYVAFFRR